MIEHIIKHFLFEQAKFRWGIIPPTPALLTAAKEAGGVYAFTAKLNFTKKSVIPSDQIIRNILTSNISDMPSTGDDSVGATGKYSNGNYIYLISNPLKESPNRLKFNVWIIERQNLKDIAVEVVDREKMTGYFTKSTSPIDFGERQIGNSDLMSYDDMARWFSALTEAATKQGVKLDLPDIQKINTIQSSIKTGEFKTQFVDITDENADEYETGFRGKAEISYTPDGDQIVTPISGRIDVTEDDTNNDGELHLGYFEGQFKNGVPFNGTWTKYQLTGNKTPDNIYSIWKGEFKTEAYENERGTRSFHIKKIPGKGKYIVDPHEKLVYPYTAQKPNAAGYTDTYYLEGDSVYFINIFADPVPAWLYIPKLEFELWTASGTSPKNAREASISEISILNKNYPNELPDAIKWKTDKQNTPVTFTSFPVNIYTTTNEEDFTDTGKVISKMTADKPQYWYDATANGYAKLVGRSKDPNKSYWVKSDQIK